MKLILAVGVLVFILAWYRKMAGVRDRALFLALHLAAAVLLLLLIVEPELSVKIPNREKKSLYVLVDTSLSMGGRNGTGTQTRLESAQRYLASHPSLKKYRPVFYSFGAGSGPVEADALSRLQPVDSSTHLGEVIADLEKKAARRTSAILLLTDGADTTGFAWDEHKEKLPVPVYVLGAGDPAPRDMRIANIISNAPLYAGERAVIGVYLEQNGADGRGGRVTLREGTTVLQEKTAAFSGRFGYVEFEISPVAAGEHIYEAAIEPADDAIPENNRDQVFIRAIPPAIKVLYVDGGLRWEYKFLKRHLESNPALDTLFLVRIGENLFQQTGGKKQTVPADVFGSRDFLDQFNVLIMGDLDCTGLTPTQQQNIRDFVFVKHRSLLILGGDNFLKGAAGSALARVLPFPPLGREYTITGPAVPLLTDEGKGFPVFDGLPALPPLERINEMTRPNRPYGTLLVGAGRPDQIIMAAASGRGKCVLLATDSTWKWYFNEGTRKTYELFWSRLTRFLWTPDDALGTGRDLPEITAERKVYAPGETVAVTVAFPPDKKNAAILVQAPDGSRQTPELKEDSFSFVPEKEGLYTVRAAIADKSAVLPVIVRTTGAEFVEPGLNEPLLKRIAALSGGRYARLDEAPAPDRFITLTTNWTRKNWAITRESRPYLLPAVYILLGLCWLIRRRDDIV